MKTILVVCGGGVATSTIICSRVDELLDEHGINHRLIQCSLNEMDSHIGEADLVVSSMRVFKKLPVPCVVGTAYISGVGEEETSKQILDVLA